MYVYVFFICWHFLAEVLDVFVFFEIYHNCGYKMLHNIIFVYLFFDFHFRKYLLIVSLKRKIRDF